MAIAKASPKRVSVQRGRRYGLITHPVPWLYVRGRGMEAGVVVGGIVFVKILKLFLLNSYGDGSKSDRRKRGRRARRRGRSKRSRRKRSRRRRRRGRRRRRRRGRTKKDSRVVLPPTGTRTTNMTIDAIRPNDFRRIVGADNRIVTTRKSRDMTMTAMTNIISFGKGIVRKVDIDGNAPLIMLSSGGVTSKSPIRGTQVTCRISGGRCRHVGTLMNGGVMSRGRFTRTRRVCRGTHVDCRTITGGRSTDNRTIISPVDNCIGGLLIGRKSCIDINRPLMDIARGHGLFLHTSMSRGCCPCLGDVNSTGFYAPCGGGMCALGRLNKHVLSCKGTSNRGKCCMPMAFRFSGGKSIVPNSFMRMFLLSSPVRGILSLPRDTLARRRNDFFICLRLSRRNCGGRLIALNTSGNRDMRVLSNVGTNSHIMARKTCRIGLTSTAGTVPTRDRRRWSRMRFSGLRDAVSLYDVEIA